MAGIIVTPEELESLSSRIGSASQEVQGIIGKLLSEVNALEGSFVGQGANAFRNLHQQWNTGANQTREGMEGLAHFLKSAADAYRTTDQQIGAAGGGA